MTKYVFLFLAALIGFLPMNADAQISERDLVRVKIVGGRQVEGRVSEVMASGLAVRSFDGFSENISFDKMESLHLKVAPRTYGRTGILIGTYVGVGVGGVAGFIVGGKLLGEALADDCEGCGNFSVLLGLLSAPVGVAVFFPPGLLIGFIVGVLTKRSDTWQEIPLTGMGSMSIEPRIGIRANGYPALGVQLVF